MTKPKPRAYSYLRFSTPEQLRGDSYRRQTELAEKWARQHSLIFDRGEGFEDMGVSAYRGNNHSSGALHQFIQAVDRGSIKPGSYLLVENLDRLSRDKVRIALRRFEELLERDITIVTLTDGKIWTKDSLDDIGSLIVSLLSMARAHEESKLKSERVKEVWKHKREQAVKASIPLTRKAPAWLEWDNKAKAFKPVSHRTKIVREIFQQFALGFGPKEIAEELNKRGIKPFGKERRQVVKRPRPASGWYPSYVQKILANPAVIGTYQPMRVVYSNDGSMLRIPDGPPLTDYFPQVVEPSLYQAAMARKARRKPVEASPLPTG